MSTQCNKCGTTFDSKFCPNCGAQAQQQLNNQHGYPVPPPIPPNVPYQQNQFRPNMPPPKRKHGCLFWGLISTGIFIALFIFSIIFVSCIGSIINSSDSTSTGAINESMSSLNRASATISPTTTPTPTIIPYIQVTSTDLIAIYKENQVKCKKLYDKQLLEVTGKVESVGTDILDNTYVCLGSDTEYTFVGIQCYAKNEDEINKISELKEGDVITVRGKGDCGSLSFSIDKAEIIE